MNATKLAETIRNDWHTFTAMERHAVLTALHPHFPVRNVNDLEAERIGRGERLADAVTGRLGSWPFIIIQSIVLMCWISLNAIGWIHHWDPYPFILLNLALSFQAAYSAPVIMMSQNRQAQKDRLAAANDFKVNLHAEADVAIIKSQLDLLAGGQWETLLEMQQRQLQLLASLHDLANELRGRVQAD
jgi:uncharacterized membrane protein